MFFRAYFRRPILSTVLHAEIKKRFFPTIPKQEPRLIILASDEWMKSYGKTTTIAQTLPHLLNLKQSYTT